jgi:FkbM family methyltransferase
MLVWDANLRPGDLFIDGGANVGIYSILASALGAHVVAVEPAKDVIPLLEENIQLNNANVEIVQAALGDAPGMANFTVGLDQENKLDPAGETPVQVITLDDVIGDRCIAGMKLDLEGAELGALLGATNALREKRIALIQLEWNTLVDRTPVAEILRSHGYGLYEPTPEGMLEPASSIRSAPQRNLFAAPLS